MEFNRYLKKALDDELKDFRMIDRKIIAADALAENSTTYYHGSQELVSHVSENLPRENLVMTKKTMDKLFKSLNSSDKQIAGLRWQEEYSWAEIAEILHFSEATVRRRKNHILKKYAELKGLI